jgi:hypothetical protein
VGNLNANIGQEEKFQKTVGRCSLPSACIFPPIRYMRKYNLQITAIRDVGSCRGAKCDTGHYLVHMTN